MITEEVAALIERILNEGNNVEIAIRNGKLVIWAVGSKKKYEGPVR